MVNEIIYLKFLSSLGKSSGEIFQNLLTFLPAYIFLVLLILSSGIFYAYRRKLRGRERQWLVLGLLLFLAFIVSSLNVLISYVFRFIDNALNGRDPKVFWEFLWVYGITLVVAIPILIAYRYTRRKLALFWREWLTNMLLKDYFSNRAYYELDSNAANTDIDNPDRRMTEDVNSFTTTILDLILDILDSVLDLVAFTGILYSISTELTFGLVGYVSIASILALWIGTKLIKINFNQLRLEGDFRYGMVHVRDNAESIAFYRGENLELGNVEGRFARAIRNYDLLIIWIALLVVGSSGCGKSSRLRAIAGLWRNGTGTIESPDYTQTLFLPQKPYMLLGTLRAQLQYPNLRANITDAEIQSALIQVNLENLTTRMGGLDTEKDWAAVLSQGEQQRLAFARILLSQPKYVILDEATSALDVTNERRLYELLQSQDISYISVGHRPSLVDYHQTVLDLRPDRDKSWQILAAEDYQFAS